MLLQALAKWTRLLWIWADGGYAGELVQWVSQVCGWGLGIVKRSEKVKGWQLLPHRWVVERAFAWLDRCRRLSKDYEFHPETGEAWVRVAMIHLMARRLALKGLLRQALKEMPALRGQAPKRAGNCLCSLVTGR